MDRDLVLITVAIATSLTAKASTMTLLRDSLWLLTDPAIVLWPQARKVQLSSLKIEAQARTQPVASRQLVAQATPTQVI
jgi:hypothetical protein